MPISSMSDGRTGRQSSSRSGTRWAALIHTAGTGVSLSLLRGSSNELSSIDRYLRSAEAPVFSGGQLHAERAFDGCFVGPHFQRAAEGCFVFGLFHLAFGELEGKGTVHRLRT